MDVHIENAINIYVGYRMQPLRLSHCVFDLNLFHFNSVNDVMVTTFQKLI